MKKTLYLLISLLSSALYAESNSWGVEFNPFRVLISDSNWQSFSGTISHFDNDNAVEIALPIFYFKAKNSNSMDLYQNKETVLNLDLHYRKYFSGNVSDGAYIGAFGRYSYLDRMLNVGQYATVKKFGVGGEVGFKIKNIFNTPFYWGASLMSGGYIGNDNDVFNSSRYILGFGDDDKKLILDLELLKVGYEF